MKCKFILLLIIIYTAISRFFLIDKIPPPLNSTIIHWRILSAFASIVSTGIIFFLLAAYYKNPQKALLSAWIFSVLPWTFEQGRISSQPNFALVFILIVFLLIQRSLFRFRFILLLLIPAILFAFYPQFWLFRANDFKFILPFFISNLFLLSSSDFLFFHNITFWWGGVRDFGVMYVSLMPFFLVGIYKLIVQGKLKPLLLLVGITIIAALSPFFPESREFYLAVPILSFIPALGIYHWSLQSKVMSRLIFICLLLFLLYEISQYFHFYFIHYPQQVTGNFSKFHEAF